ncbi:dTDP-4-dehydrorhamnose reductase [Candidatus Daviesbacteria bacterium]|nr:dTDP-4-dehydrorhamnose reductase [Candidatus Daviesbacteria bacterium]
MEKIIVFGGSGLVGSRFVQLNQKKFDISAPIHSEVDLLDPKSLADFIEKSQAKAVVNFAAFTNVDGAEKEKDDKNGLAFKLNAMAPKNLAAICLSLNLHLVHLSTDYVFDGQKENAPYTEEDEMDPINWYGLTKMLGEEEILQSGCFHTIARIEMPYRANFAGRSDFARFFLEKLQTGQKISAVNDQKITPTFVDDVAKALTVMIKKPTQGIFHVVSTNPTSPYQFALTLAQQFGLNKELVEAVKFADFNQGRPACRPQNSWLDTKKFINTFGEGVLHSVEEEISLFNSQC